MTRKSQVLSSIQAKLFMMFLLLIVAPLILIGVIAFQKASDMLAQKSFSLEQIQIARLRVEFDDVIQDIKRFAEVGKKDSTVQFLIDNQNTAEEAEKILEMITLFRESYPYSDSIMSIKIIDFDGKAVSENRGVHQIVKGLLAEPPFVQIVDQPTKTVIEPVYKNSNPALSLTSAITLNDSKEVIGFINIVVKAAIFKDILRKDSLRTTGTIQIESETGSILFSTPQMMKTLAIQDKYPIGADRSGYFTEDATFYAFDTSPVTGWTFIRHKPVSEVTKEIAEIRRLTVLAISSLLLLAIGLYVFISSRLVRPLRVLNEKMEQVSQGNLDAKFGNRGVNEIADVGDNFNRMVLKMRTMLTQSVNEQKQLKIAELRTMQAQINPHFLYNTLETIIWLAEARKSQQIIKITKALSHFFRISLSKGKDVIPLKDELEHIQNYLMIQKIRYQDILDVSFHLNEDILKFEIIKLTLQPLVENAIYHGIKNKHGKGFVRIKGDFSPEGYISIDVIDNGIGMTEDKLETIKNALSQGMPLPDQNQGGFGMLNVHQRIRLHYGEPFGLTINSWYGSGTRVSLIIPAERRIK